MLVLADDRSVRQCPVVQPLVQRLAWCLPSGFPSAPLSLPSEHGGSPVAHPRVMLVQAPRAAGATLQPQRVGASRAFG